MPFIVIEVANKIVSYKAGLFKTRDEAQGWCDDHDPARYAPTNIDWHYGSSRQYREHTPRHLRVVARRRAEMQGHKLQKFQAFEKQPGTWCATCAWCGFPVWITPRPKPGHPDMTGPAITQECNPTGRSTTD